NATNGTNGAQNALQRGLEALQENCSEETEEIRKLDSQLDHLNDYMSKMEERLKLHNEKLMETLRHQKEEREKRRRSFHEDSVLGLDFSKESTINLALDSNL
ncbi:hypothetical protein ANCCAN_30613, partial [Ancylostoma caninum]